MKIPHGDTIVFDSRPLFERAWALVHDLATCNNCKNRDGQYCTHPQIEEMTEQWGCIYDTRLPEGFGCVHWEPKV